MFGCWTNRNPFWALILVAYLHRYAYTNTEHLGLEPKGPMFRKKNDSSNWRPTHHHGRDRLPQPRWWSHFVHFCPVATLEEPCQLQRIRRRSSSDLANAGRGESEWSTSERARRLLGLPELVFWSVITTMVTFKPWFPTGSAPGRNKICRVCIWQYMRGH